MTTNNLNDIVAYTEAKGLSKVWMAYLVTDFNDGAEFFFDNYETAIKQMEALS
jgi:hypothetical protein